MARAAAVLLLAALAALPVRAQETTLAPGPAQRCLLPAPAQRGLPDYPAKELAWKEQGRVKVELTFTTPDKRPAVRVIESEGSDAFVDSVQQHVRSFRTPCIEASEVPARLVQEYRFQPDGRQVGWHDLEPQEAGERQSLLACQVHPDRDEASYPVAAQRDGVQGRVLVVATHVAPDRPPEVVAYAVGRAVRYLQPDAEWRAAKSRVPCLGGQPLRSVLTYVYRFEGDSHFGFRDTSFLQFVGAMKPIHHQGVEIDTGTMDCPFDVSLHYRQPVLPNRVGVVGGEATAERAPLLRWLTHAELDLKPRMLEAAFGDTVQFTVPCVKLALKLKESP